MGMPDLTEAVLRAVDSELYRLAAEAPEDSEARNIWLDAADALADAIDLLPGGL